MPITFSDIITVIQLIVTCIVAIGGGYWAVTEYDEKKDQERINHSFEFATAFIASNDYQKYRKFSISDEVNNILGKNLSPEQESIAIAAAHNQDMKLSLANLIEKVENMIICVNVNYCDKGTLAAFMATPASDIYVTGYSVIDGMRKQYNNLAYACSLVKIRHWTCSPEFIDNRLRSASWCQGQEPAPCNTELD